MRIPKGFSFAATNAGIKAHKKDMALVASELPCSAAGVLTVNRAKAPPVEHAEKRLPGKGISAIVLNSGNANALTGDAGREDVKAIHAAMALALGIPQDAVLSMSTGVIGVRLPVQKLVTACDALAKSRGEGIVGAAEAIMTTDTRVKLTHRMLTIKGTTVTIAAFAKGSGMVAPEMATVLGVITTDAAIDSATLRLALVEACEDTFNAITVDGECSTNDTVFALASGASGVSIDQGTYAAFVEALREVCMELALGIVRGGEGATKLVTVHVTGAATYADAKQCARAIANSLLVKTAIHGGDPNWGRLVAVAGRSGSAFDLMRARVLVGETVMFEGGRPFDERAPLAAAHLAGTEVDVTVDLGMGGDHDATMFTCDLTADYVRINADYRT